MSRKKKDALSLYEEIHGAKEVQDQPEVRDDYDISVGDIVHYMMPRSGIIRPAIVVAIYDDLVNLQVFTDMRNDGLMESVLWVRNVKQDEEEWLQGTWHWPRK